MNPMKSNNIVAKILQVYAYVNGAVGIILALLLVEDLGALVAAIVFASVLVDLLQNLKENTNGGRAVSDELPEL